MEKNCAKCGKAIIPGMYYYSVNPYHFCSMCASKYTLKNLDDALHGALSACDEPIEVDGLVDQTADDYQKSKASLNSIYGMKLKEMSSDLSSYGIEGNASDYVADVHIYTDEEREAHATEIARKEAEMDAAMNEHYGVTPEQTGFDRPPQGCIKDCEHFPCDTCEHYYGEGHMCMYGEDSGLVDQTVEELTEIVDGKIVDKKTGNVICEFDDDPAQLKEASETIAHDIDSMSHDDFFSKYADNPDALHAYVDANGEPDICEQMDDYLDRLHRGLSTFDTGL